jgi:hypothetical protein
MTAVDDPRTPGFGTGLTALVIAVLPAAWIGIFLVLGQIVGTDGTQTAMLAAEPFALPILAALALVIALFALWRDTPRGRTFAVIAISAVLLQAAAIVILLFV